jgi:hypothetical protein
MASTSAPRGTHVSATWHPRQRHVAPTSVLRGIRVSATSSPCGIHVIATGQPRRLHMAATSAPRGSHVSAAWQPCQCRVASTSSPRGSHVITTWQPRHHHVASMSSPSGSHVSNQLISISDVASQSIRSLSSQILGFRLGSMSFTPIYDDLRTSWITLIYDENVSSSRRLICDAQYMMF